jgi:hypothetical protein
MTGLDLETFLRVLRADPGTWLVLGLGTLGLGLLVWACWGSRKALRKCLVASLAIHCGLALYGSTIPALRWVLGADRSLAATRAHIRKIRVAPLPEPVRAASVPPAVGKRIGPASEVRDADGAAPPRWELAAAPVRLAELPLRVPRPPVEDVTARARGELPQEDPTPVTAAGRVIPRGARPEVAAAQPENRPDLDVNERAGGGPGSGPDIPAALPVPMPLPPSLTEVAGDAAAQPAGRSASETAQGGMRRSARASSPGGIVLSSDRRLRVRPEPMPITNGIGAQANAEKPPGPRPGAAGGGPGAGEVGAGTRPTAPRESGALALGSLELAHATPKGRARPAPAALDERWENRSLPDVPRIYQPRVEPNRSARAQHGGASLASELAVERALDWLSRHQDPDGRWDGGIARYADGAAVKGDHDFTAHCPPGEKCFGACAYWEADTALTGLALLTYLGAGYTHKDGRYAEVVSKGLEFLLSQQKEDGDLRGRSRVVGMYCHAMATLGLCEAYALTGDSRLRNPAERAVSFLVSCRARDGMAWRYAPGAPVGDTSILGWVVMGLKSAKETGIPIPDELSVRKGTLAWLDRVATGSAGGLARYQPWEPVTPTMTAEAWVCRQFLGVGGPGAASTEAAQSLLRNDSDRGPSNFYYWYYATLALYQHGGEAWRRWNSKIRDRVVGLQCSSGHQTGSWEPDGSIYGAKGGRVYSTTLAALSLEVYYRYLRLYDEPSLPQEAGETSATQLRTPARSALASPLTNPEDR